MAGYLGAIPVPQATQNRESFTCSANQTSFATAGYTVGFVDAFLNGVRLNTADFTATNGSDIVLASGAAENDVLDVISYATFEVNAQTFTGTTTLTDVVAASLDISGNIDIDGITNLDVVDIDGAVNMATTLLVTGNVDFNGDLDVDGTTNLDVVDIDGAVDMASTVVVNSGNNSGVALKIGGEGGGGLKTQYILASGHTNYQIGVATHAASVLSITPSTSAGNTTFTNPALNIAADGNVGIGTTSIDVSTQAGGSGYKALQIESDEGGQLNFDHNDAGTGSTIGQINFQRAGEVVAEIEGVTDGATDNGRIAFRTQPNGGALTERVRIDSVGRLYLGPSSTTIENQADSTGAASFQFGNSFLCHFDTDAAGTMVLSNNKFFDGSNNRTAETGLTTDYLQSAGKHTFRTAGSASANAAVTMNNALVIETNKDITITDGNLVVGTNGHGIDFSAQTQSSSTTVSEILDHYEEGTTDPTVNGGHFDMASGTIGSYTRVGNIVNFQAKLVFPSNSNGNEARITLPFVVSTRPNYFPTGANGPNGTTAASHCLGIGGQSYIVFQPTSGATSSTLANLSAANVNVNITYQTTP